MTTRAMVFLEKKKIPFTPVCYEHLEKGAEFAAKSLGFPLAKTVKTLVIDLGNQRYALALMPGDKKASMKLVAEACCVKRAAMVDIQTAQRVTGYWVGGISPFGTKKTLPVVMEQGLLDHGEVIINGGQRGVMLIMDPKDILRACNGRPALICHH
jgi:Cys-tRNA(Pro)/Cys-tRNA(Cys) deacylase